ncbi:hypothetical protein [Streptomyces lunaelactis]|uniref:hypothetical protein n=1 Tax=Streptomyces lunaelactis TaxID=1535768 RepID=UPI001FE27EFD|nr:hypothetical protein [Streptomyces lunaelactis]
MAPRLGGGLLLAIGAYVAYYGWYEIRVQRDPTAQDPLIDAAGAVQRTIANALDTIGPASIAALFARLLVTGVIIRRRRVARRGSATSSPPASHTPLSG